MISSFGSSPSPSRSGTTKRIPEFFRQIFNQNGINLSQVSQLISGVKLAELVNKVFYHNENNEMRKAIKIQDQQRKGNNVLNMNVVLKHIKNNKKVKCPEFINQLSAFKLLDSENLIIELVKWVCESDNIINKQNKKESVNQNEQYREYDKQNQKQQMTSHKKTKEKNMKQQLNFKIKEKNILKTKHDDDQNIETQDHAFDNVFFCDRDISPSKVNIEMNDSLELSEKISKKGSFKIIRPKSNFDESSIQKNLNEKNNEQTFEKGRVDIKIHSKNERGLQKQNEDEFERFYSEQKDVSARKTVPKMAQRPPIYRKINKQQTKVQSKEINLSHIKQPAPFILEQNIQLQPQSLTENVSIDNSLLKNNYNIQSSISKIPSSELKVNKAEIQKSILDLEQQIKRQKSDADLKSSGTYRSRNRDHSNSHNSRKLFKLQIPETSEDEKKNIIQWLISINLLNSMAISYFERFHEICKNGIIFAQIVNFQKGKANQLCYFKNPVKSAEIHSNYQKVFAYFKQVPNFESPLLFMYDYFIPEALESAFWSLLKSCYQAFNKSVLVKNKIFNRDSSICERLKTKPDKENNSQNKQSKTNSSEKRLKASIIEHNSQAKQYEKIKYGNSKKFRQSSNISKKKPETQREHETPSRQINLKRKSSLEFIKQLPEKQSSKLKQQQLIQIDEPQQSSKQKGYKQLHQLRKNHNTSSFINTPKKNVQISMNGSRLAHQNTNSVKKLPTDKAQQPSVTLQMQMKVIKFLKEKNLLNFSTFSSLPLFEDPIRNGVLLNNIIIQETKNTHKYIQKPRNIVDCRQNFKKAFFQLKDSFIVYPKNYEYFYEEIIKGEVTLFYGIVYYIIFSNSISKGGLLGQNALKNQSAIMNISKNNIVPFDSIESTAEQVLFWIRELQQQCSSISQLQIRDVNYLITAIVSHNLLFKISECILCEKYTLKPTYEQAMNHMEQQSNIKKILSFFAHNKVIKNDFVWKAKSIVKKDKEIILKLMKNLMNYAKNTRKPANINVHESLTDNPVVSFVKFIRQNSRQNIKEPRLETTMANNSFSNQQRQSLPSQQSKQILDIQVPWMRSLGFTDDLSINNGVVLCRLMSKLTMETVICNQNPGSKAQCLTNIRRALKLIEKSKWDEQDIINADKKLTMDIYKFLKEKYKHSYVLKNIN